MKLSSAEPPQSRWAGRANFFPRPSQGNPSSSRDWTTCECPGPPPFPLGHLSRRILQTLPRRRPWPSAQPAPGLLPSAADSDPRDLPAGSWSGPGTAHRRQTGGVRPPGARPRAKRRSWSGGRAQTRRPNDVRTPRARAKCRRPARPGCSRSPVRPGNDSPRRPSATRAPGQDRPSPRDGPLPPAGSSRIDRSPDDAPEWLSIRAHAPAPRHPGWAGSRPRRPARRSPGVGCRPPTMPAAQTASADGH